MLEHDHIMTVSGEEEDKLDEESYEYEGNEFAEVSS